MRGCCLLILLVLGACAPGGPSDLHVTVDGAATRTGLESHRKSRVEDIAARIRRAAADFCATHRNPEVERQAPLLRPSGDCDFPVTVSDSRDINAYSDGHEVRITEALVSFAVDDAELAFVIAHEMAHNLIHVGTGAFGGPRRQQEYQADHMGLYLVARAGFSPEAAIRLLSRLANRDVGRLHPDYPPFNARHDRLPDIVARISRKQAAGLPLIPEHLVSELVARRAD